MKLLADLHIHSALSPCADDEMTPGNIVSMASIAGLNAIAITDHNIALNVPAAIEFGKKLNVLVVPGMELETQEEIHVVCLFSSLDGALSFQDKVFGFSLDKKNNADIFGHQYVYNADDEIAYEYEKMLISATGISIDNVFQMAEEYDGIAYAAHVDRDSYSVYSQLGALPFDYPHGFVEISTHCDSQFLDMHTELEGYKLLTASDSHYLSTIDSNGMYIECETYSARGIIKALRNNSIYREKG